MSHAIVSRPGLPGRALARRWPALAVPLACLLTLPALGLTGTGPAGRAPAPAAAPGALGGDLLARRSGPAPAPPRRSARAATTRSRPPCSACGSRATRTGRSRPGAGQGH